MHSHSRWLPIGHEHRDACSARQQLLRACLQYALLDDGVSWARKLRSDHLGVRGCPIHRISLFYLSLCLVFLERIAKLQLSALLVAMAVATYCTTNFSVYLDPSIVFAT